MSKRSGNVLPLDPVTGHGVAFQKATASFLVLVVNRSSLLVQFQSCISKTLPSCFILIYALHDNDPCLEL
ncbi:MAG: hypothetical protein ACFFD4_26730 [Candidatus Odinarchaeota archaeon]